MLFRDDPDVFVAGDLLWYPVEGDNRTRMAPDALVAFGRPKGDRGSYLQWREGGVAPQVVFEVTSPRIGPEELDRRRSFYERYGVEEYYVYDPDRVTLQGWSRDAGELRPIAPVEGWTSPRLGIRFEIGDELILYHPDGRLFVDFVENERQRAAAEREARRERQRADQARTRTDEARVRADAAHADDERARETRERLEALLRARGIEPED